MDSSLDEQNEPEFEPTPEVPEIMASRELITKAESLFDQVSKEDKEDMIDLIETLTTNIDAGDIKGLEEPAVQLTDIIYYLES
jgi:hypothetical protein